MPELELSIVLTSDRPMRRLNRSWRDKDRTTDVLSFPMTGSGVGEGLPHGHDVLGDVVINTDAASRQARERAVPLADEMLRLLVHGLAHLLGYDHEQGRTEAARMRAMERRLLSAVKRPRR